jgi:hypothetical protein
VLPVEFVVEDGERLPRKLAAGTEAADIAANDQISCRRSCSESAFR